MKKSVPNKTQKNLYLTNEALRLLEELAARRGIADSAVIELLIRDAAAKDNIK